MTLTRSRLASPRAAILALLAIVCVIAGATSDAHASDRYPLAPGDKISILVFGQPDFTAETVLDESGSVAMPLLGPVAIAGLTPAEAAARIAHELAQGYLERPAVTVRLQEYRPVYVLGAVRTPGGYPFRHGLSVLSAVALAGGFGAAEQPGVSARGEFLLAHERLTVLERTQRHLLIRRARLEAQRDGKASFTFPVSLDEEADGEIREQEDEMLRSQRQVQAERLDLLRAQKPRLEAEMEGVRAQAASERRQLELIQMHLKDYTELMASGLARRYTGIELQREEARNKGNIARLAADLSRLEIGLGEVALRINEAEESYQRRVMTELAETRQKLREIELTLPIARELRDTKLLQGGAMPFDESAVSISVTRSSAEGRTVILAENDMLLRPGDIVEIARKAPARIGSPIPAAGARPALAASRSVPAR